MMKIRTIKKLSPLLVLACAIPLGIAWLVYPGRLEMAAYKGDVETMRRLLDRGYDPHRRSADVLGKGQRTTPMHWGLDGQSAEAVRVLAEGGAEIESESFGLLRRAMYARCGDCVLELLRYGANPNAVASDNTTILSLAVERNAITIAKHLLHHGADPIIANDNGSTALEVAIGYHLSGRIALIDFESLLRVMFEAGMAPNIRIDRWYTGNPTILMLFARHADPRLVQLAIVFGADASLTDTAGRTACDYVEGREDGKQKVIQQLLRNCIP